MRASCRTMTTLFSPLLVALISMPPAMAGVYRVGPGCQYPDLATAYGVSVADLAPEFRLSGDQTAQQLVINGRKVVITGGYADCAADTPNGHSTLNGSGGARTSVISIRGNSQVTLSNLWIAFGDDTASDDNGGSGGGHGGGIDFRGQGSLELLNSAVLLNQAAYGGGINAAGSGPLDIVIGTGTRIYSNSASVSGGGVRLEGQATLTMVEPDSAVFGNLADTGYGGGVLVIGPAQALIGSPGIVIGGRRRGAVHDNVAEYGGGIALSSTIDHAALLRMFGTDPAHPVRVDGNRARRSGGGLWLRPAYDFNDRTSVKACLYDFRIDANSAREGAAIYLDATQSQLGPAFLQINRYDRCGGAPAELGAVRCTPGRECNAIDGNQARDPDNQPTTGAIVLLQTEAELEARRVQFYRNRGGSLVRGVESDTIPFFDCVMGNNTVTGPLLRSEGGARIEISRCTIADNTIGGSVAITGDGGVSVVDSILHERPGLALLGGSGARETMHLLVSDRASVDGGNTPYVFDAKPRFMDPAHDDFRLQAASPAIDAAPESSGTDRDLDHRWRNRDLAGIDYGFGPRDLGAYERQEIGDNLVLNPGFPPRTDGDELRLWSRSGANADAVWIATEGYDGAGAVRVTYDPDLPPGTGTGAKTTSPYLGLSQCVHLPLPATYTVSAATRMPGTLISRDYASLEWALYPDDDTCSGTPVEQGEVPLPRSSAWTLQSGTLYGFQIAPGQWNSSSSVRISLRLAPNTNGSVNSVVTGYFDAIKLQPSGLPVQTELFRDGFED